MSRLFLSLPVLFLGLLLLPGMSRGEPAITTSKYTSNLFFNEHFLPGEGLAPEWDGNIDAGLAGSVSDEYFQATHDRLNWYRRMAGLSEVQLRSSWNQMCSEAALMMSANGTLDHKPPTSWRFYTPGGAKAAAKSNLAINVSGPFAIDGFMADPGEINDDVGHRRLFLHPSTKEMGIGMVVPDVFATSYFPVIAVWVLGGKRAGLDSSDIFAWPPPGYVPYYVLFEKFSLSIPSADFSRATVAMSVNGVRVPVKVISRSTSRLISQGKSAVRGRSNMPEYRTPDDDSSSDDYIAYKQDDDDDDAYSYHDASIAGDGYLQSILQASATASDATIEIEVRKVKIDGKSRRVRYTVIGFEPVSDPVDDGSVADGGFSIEPPLDGGKGAPPVLRKKDKTNGTVGQTFLYTIKAKRKPTSFFSKSTFPEGLVLDTTAGTISGVPTTPGKFIVRIFARNSKGKSRALKLTITILP